MGAMSSKNGNSVWRVDDRSSVGGFAKSWVKEADCVETYNCFGVSVENVECCVTLVYTDEYAAFARFGVQFLSRCLYMGK